MSPAPPAAVATGVAPAGFWRRYAAWSLDWLLLSSALGLLLAGPIARAWLLLQAVNQQLEAWVYTRVVAADGAMPSPLAMTFELLGDRALSASLMEGVGRLDATIAQIGLVVLGVGAAWFIGFEASGWQATPGKRLAGLEVRAANGASLGWVRVALRHVAGALSWMALNLGHALAGWRGDHRALHDLIAGAQVIAQGPMPRWARLWLIAQATALLAFLLGGFGYLAWMLWQIATLG